VRGSVVDIRFDEDLPPIYSLLSSSCWLTLTPTQGLARGMPVENSGGPQKAPVGKGILSRMFNVFGNAIDREGEVSNVELRTVHRTPRAHVDIHLYYGAADTSIALATGSVRALLE